jgi:4-methyl-5(b-hydroxyethyl)-thiazole monophosphate biosynthesis
MKGLLIVHNDNEDLEVVGTRDLLIRADFDVTMATFGDTLDIELAYGTKIKVDSFMSGVNREDYDFVVIPGGKFVKHHVDKDTEIKDLVTEFHNQNKLVAAICAGPRFLGQAGLLDNRRFTAFTGAQSDMPRGYYHPDEKAVTDKNIITARGAGAVHEFAYHITYYLKGEHHAKALLKSILY